MKTKTEVGWAKCWLASCEKSATVLVRFKASGPFSLVWYCGKDAKVFIKKNSSARTVQRLVDDREGHLFLRLEPKDEKK